VKCGLVFYCVFLLPAFTLINQTTAVAAGGISGSVSTTAATKEKPAIKNASATRKTTRIASNQEVCVFFLVGVMTDAGT